MKIIMTNSKKFEKIDQLAQEALSCSLNEILDDVPRVYSGLGSTEWKCRACCLWIIKDCMQLEKNEKVQIAKAMVYDQHPEVAKLAWSMIGREFAATFDDAISVFCANFIIDERNELSVRNTAYRCLEMVRTPKPEFVGQFNLEDLMIRVEKLKELKDSLLNPPEIDWDLISSLTKSGKKP